MRETLGAFSVLSGMAVKLVPLGTASHAPFLAGNAAPLCRLLCQDPRGAAACRQFMSQVQCQGAVPSPKGGAARQFPVAPPANPRATRTLRTHHCFAGLTEVAAPIMARGTLLATLLCGGVLRAAPTRKEFWRCWRRLRELGVRLDPQIARQAYWQTPIAPPARLRAARRLLAELAQRLGELAAQYIAAPRPTDPKCVACAKALVTQDPGHMPCARQAARKAQVTEPYFCRAFKAATGMTFSEYVARCHVDRARQLLHDPDLRVTEVAFAAGFQSIPHFNHTFKRYTGLSPKRYRASLRKR
ncbi:MAG TPA: helix-turn-helix domain-containing protein [Verrucomicrobiota bacterium]|nr:helix-turn-helix domain-containing protein [Verrucomicrobiota bacterium]HQL79032.1 helix-turn-helix domain-containing protein [Verrucomicrobiota bacterium]